MSAQLGQSMHGLLKHLEITSELETALGAAMESFDMHVH